MTSADSTLTVVVPVFNEGRHLERVVRYLLNSNCPIQREWIFIDDASTDGSFEILEKLKSEFKFTLLRQNQNLGKGSAVRRGFESATGDFILIQDADFEYDVEDVSDLLQPLLGADADAVYGSRFKKNAQQVHRTYHYFANRFLTGLSNLFSGIYLTDMETCYKVFRADLAKSMNLKSQRFGIEVELTAYVAKTSARIVELPIRYYPRTRLQGKKITWKDGLAATWHLVYFNFLVSFVDAFRELPIAYDPTKRDRS